ncbi:MAG: tryptophan synthase subunit alpha [Sediminibacterium sp.]|nr:tryptophan synthase subunit alpha [Sediminibacterium sp.]
MGVDGLILPDLPEYEYEKMYADIIKKNNLNFIFLITPETSVDRIKKLDQLSSGFLYAVSSSSTTGSQIDANQVDAYLKRLQSYQLINPILVGFGIKDQQSFMRACQYTNGAIIGSAYIRALTKGGNVQTITEDFLSAITTQK